MNITQTYSVSISAKIKPIPEGQGGGGEEQDYYVYASGSYKIFYITALPDGASTPLTEGPIMIPAFSENVEFVSWLGGDSTPSLWTVSGGPGGQELPGPETTDTFWVGADLEPGSYTLSATKSGRTCSMELIVPLVEYVDINVTDRGTGAGVEDGQPVIFGQIQWDGVVTLEPDMTPFPGTLQFVQLVKMERTITFTDGSQLRAATDGFELDGVDPYTSGVEAVDGLEGFYKLNSNDVPTQGLIPMSIPDIQELSMTHHFKLYFLWKPDSSDRVPLGKLEWYWNSFYKREGEKLVEQSSSVGEGGAQASSEIPSWTEVLDDIDFEVSIPKEPGDDGMAGIYDVFY